MEYEYGIAHHRHDPNGAMEDEQGPHLSGMTLERAQRFIDEWEIDGGRPGAFYIIRRPKGPWERVNKASTKMTAEKDQIIQSIRDRAKTLPQGPL